MTIEEMKIRRKELGYSCRELSELSGIPLGTVQKIFGGVTVVPRRETMMKLQKILQEEPFPPIMRESQVSYNAGSAAGKEKAPGEHTVEDYYALPDDQRMELIDGVFYDMSAPTSAHQLIGMEICAQLREFHRKHKTVCLPMVSPVDVQLDRDDKTVVQPDVLIVCDRSKITMKGVFGAPDFIAEVLSPSTRRKDLFIKLAKYTNAGVREYWVVDAAQRKVIVYDLEHEAIPVICSFADPVPVGIWGGECRVDLAELGELLDELFPELRMGQKEPECYSSVFRDGGDNSGS